ncbi:dTMP kinase [Micromonospora sp. NPDC005324]|uniref:dTMP kinase n=1 Tax=Micromonospora sp. NPDC005324 TaxID=3157033 RepID=UPI0033B5BD41
MQRYPFIVIEGLDGTGKTTVRKGLFRLWEGLYGITPMCILTSNFLAANTAADLVEGKYQPSTDNRDRYLEALVADKAATLAQLVRPALVNRPVISDRWLVSELAFFAVKHDMKPRDTYERLAAGITEPVDVTLVLDLDPSDSLQRAHGRQGDAVRADWDVLDVQARVRQVYTEIVNEPAAYPLLGNVAHIDASASPGAVLNQVWRALIEHDLVPQRSRDGRTGER